MESMPAYSNGNTIAPQKSQPQKSSTLQAKQIDSFRFLSRGGKSGTLSIVVGGQHLMFQCTLTTALHGAESIMAATRKMAESR